MPENFFDQHPDYNHPSNVAKREEQWAAIEAQTKQAAKNAEANEKARLQQLAAEEAEEERVATEQRIARDIAFLDECRDTTVDSEKHYWLHPLPQELQGGLYENIKENLLNNQSHLLDGEADIYWRLPVPYIDIATSPDKTKFLVKCRKCHTTRVVEDISKDVSEQCRFHPEELLEQYSLAQLCSRCFPNYKDDQDLKAPRPSAVPCESRPAHEWKSDQNDPFWTDAALLYSKHFETQMKGLSPTRVVVIDAEMVEVEKPDGGWDPEIVTFSAVDLFTNEVLINEIVRPHDSDRETARIDYKAKYTGFNKERLDYACTNGLAISLRDLQNKVLSLIGPHTIIAGWGVHNDMKCLRLAHPRVFDLQVLYRRKVGRVLSLENGAQAEYDITLQEGVHSSLIDALATAEMIRRWDFHWSNRKEKNQHSPDGGHWSVQAGQLDQQALAQRAREDQVRAEEWKRKEELRLQEWMREEEARSLEWRREDFHQPQELMQEPWHTSNTDGEC